MSVDVCVVVNVEFSRPGGGQFLRWPWSLAVGFVVAVSTAAVSTFFFLQQFSFSSASIPVVFLFSSFEGIYFG